jgi:ABC-2 type transport system ATP-binding protein
MARGAEVLIEINAVTKSFEGEAAVRPFSLRIHKGSVFGLLGSNGAGKTTLLKMMAGIYKPDTGEVRIESQCVYENPLMKQRIVFVPDAPYFFPQTNVLQMAKFYKDVYTSWSDDRFAQLAKVFQLDPKRKLHRFSKGMQRQAAFWLALSCMPDILILDEPIDGLDPVMRKQIKKLLFQEAAERSLTIVISSHNLREIEDLCDHVGIMHKGKLLVDKELDHLMTDTHKVQVAFRDQQHEEEAARKLRIMHREERGSVRVYVVKGEQESIRNVVMAYSPYIFDMLPLTLEEIFIYEMGDVGYDIQPILL